MSRGEGERGMRVLLSVAVLLGLVTCRGRRDAPNLYRRYCSDCHGVDGGGNGQFADEFRIPPTDFRRGSYKFKRTASGEPPTDGDIVRTLEHGARGTGMIPQLQLSESERADMAAYVRNLADRPPQGESRRLSMAPAPAVMDRELGQLWSRSFSSIRVYRSWLQPRPGITVGNPRDPLPRPPKLNPVRRRDASLA